MTPDQIYKQWVKDANHSKCVIENDWIPSPIIVAKCHVHTEIRKNGTVKVYSLLLQNSGCTITLDKPWWWGRQNEPHLKAEAKQWADNPKNKYVDAEIIIHPISSDSTVCFKNASEQMEERIKTFLPNLMFL